MTLVATIQIGIICAVVVIFLKYLYSRHAMPYPPGPKPLPLIGNTLDIPTGASWLRYAEWAKPYGIANWDLIHVHMFGTHIVAVNSIRIANDLLDKRSNKYSSRPVVPMLEIMSDDFNVAALTYGEKWRRHRRLIHQNFRADLTLHHYPIIMNKAHCALRNLLEKPEDFITHIRHMTASVIMSILYDYEVNPNHDRYLEVVEQVMDMMGHAFNPGAFLVNVIPQLQYLPEWFPGMGFKDFARRCLTFVQEMQDTPFDYAKARFTAGVGSSCITSELLANMKEHDYTEREIKRMAATIFTGALLSQSVSAISTAFLAMVLFPEPQEKAQAEIDSVIGNSRLPEFSDRDSLPYVEAFFREILRWRPPTPLGVAHASTEDDVYEGYFIPKGSIILPNVWAMQHNEESYPNPDEFRPERFIADDGTLKGGHEVVFGFGRRICPGRHMADAQVWAMIALVLSVFCVTKAKDANGNDVEVDGRYSDGALIHPLPFKCSIVPRHERASQLINETANLV
ncbi:hypothetical protein JAAARDRAFT_692211 [Jaapia argillacea MUCL 33604]|uniref:Cytochrome P450 n=1 Tax=Jaapia argillacea MUCL 33604 TaxID=933084 RepID=A0A067PKX4_9AGAM|nr:hypothetical protein JAAARDRAFT_692211 [Jaapia argillacea MUCL 33604]